MNYIQVTIRLDGAADFVKDLLPAYLAEVGFDSFEETARGVIAYCPSDLFDETAMKATIEEIPSIDMEGIAFRISDIADRNWNEVWETTGFEPIVISEECVIRPSDKAPPHKYLYDIIINPVQSFGSGYHETTRMILRMLLCMKLDGITALDMGCGTAVLAILAAMRDAKSVTAIDIDPWSQRNAKENAESNNLSEKIEVMLGDASTLHALNRRFSLIMANINRNILLADMDIYASSLDTGGQLIMSGFYTDDFNLINDKATSLGLTLTERQTDNDWLALRYVI
jgi:ribosomal protein L11 methyltransferase